MKSVLNDVRYQYCGGCSHGMVHRMIGEVLDELQPEKIIGVAPVGCSVVIYNYFNIDFVQAAHGRAPAVASGVKRMSPDSVVFTYQGDGDLASIGTAEIIHAANRGEKITTIFINNGVFGMTGGQMAPTTLEGQKTTTSPYGRKVKESGYPIKVCEMLKNLNGVSYLARGAVYNLKEINKSKQLIKKAFLNQIEEKGFSLVEILGICPTNWKLTPVEALKRLEKEVVVNYPLGEFVVKG